MKLWRQGQQQHQKAIGHGLASKTTTLQEHHAFLYIYLPSLHDYNVKWPNFKFFFQDWKSKAINSTISVWTWVHPPLFSSNINSLLLSNLATWDNGKMIWKDAESIFQQGFSWTSLLSDHKIPICCILNCQCGSPLPIPTKLSPDSSCSKGG